MLQHINLLHLHLHAPLLPHMWAYPAGPRRARTPCCRLQQDPHQPTPAQRLPRWKCCAPARLRRWAARGPMPRPHGHWPCRASAPPAPLCATWAPPARPPPRRALSSRQRRAPMRRTPPLLPPRAQQTRCAPPRPARRCVQQHSSAAVHSELAMPTNRTALLQKRAAMRRIRLPCCRRHYV